MQCMHVARMSVIAELSIRATEFELRRIMNSPGPVTVELAETLGISDQAVTERLRRAIVRLVTNTILTSPSN